ncbi:hypothetical protein KJ934_00620 [Patescibacteria group bacterium]|nr:hypothetical protein [Patescibacteria group bacterium]MBU4476909.1 hypothetical protein [Patescibacteria group bacterium]
MASDVFISDDPVISGKLTKLGYSFSTAVAHGNRDLANAILVEAEKIKRKYRIEKSKLKLVKKP